ncbi:transcription factor bHLH110-like isoform X1 [Mangifera indica]|uniref:transcription factor bHLH110-like isoform X1 n=1 Tax=Mangifera indica TaxID=29780 RepID=UPI001CFACE0F|nr:transcription factor bHLH110-like isoform X1 [Mangifera indica]
MDSANIHHQHQLQDHLAGSSSLSTPSCYGVASSHPWTPTLNPNVTLNISNFNPNYNGFISNSRQKNEIHVPPPNSSVIQEASLHWTNNAGSFTSQAAHDMHFSKIKDKLSDSFPKFTDMLNSPSNITDQKGLHDDLSEKLLLKTISSDFPLNGNQFCAGKFYSNAQDVSSFGNAIPSRGNFSQIYPSINVSNLNQSSSATSSSFDMNLQALDLLTSSRFSGNFSHPSHNNLCAYRESLPLGLDDHMQQSRRRPSSSPSEISSFTNDVTEAKRSSGTIEQKATQSAPKKSRLESRPSCPPFKVRKEKLGDRIAALQQLVAPFGKTDTASVLMEAIGYIKFLQNQVETLSVPYMKSSRNKTCRTVQGGSMGEGVKEEPTRDLRSRGLCLVPLSCMSYVTNDIGGGGGIWPPPNFGEINL